MSLRILFADDSVTAQSMGKKILTEAGYEVIAVSNGAAAVKKIAEMKPDIIILDVYMPGYSGLEVCEKVRSNIATIKTPVLLTVGKMEPYKPEDANRVRADGVIIKPFEASDLLAIIKKFEERIKAMPPPAVMAPPPARKVDLYPEPETPEPAVRAKIMQPTVEVPDHMASSSAFSDLLGSEAGYPTPHFVVPSSPSQADETARLSALPDYEVPMSWRPDSAPEPMVLVPPPQAAPVAAAPIAAESPAPVAVSEPEPEVMQEPLPEAVAETDALPVTEVAMDAPPSDVVPPPELSAPEISTPVGSAPATPRPIQIPVYQDPNSASAEFMPTAVAPIGDMDVPREPALQESAEEITRSTVADVREAGLVPTSHTADEAASGTVPFAAASPVPVTEMSVGQPAEIHETALDVAPPMIESQPQETSSPSETSALKTAVEPAPPLETIQASEPASPEPPPPPPTLTNDDFEARVDAAMAAYSNAQPGSAAQAEVSTGRNGLSDVPASAPIAAPPTLEVAEPVQAVPEVNVVKEAAPLAETATPPVNVQEPAAVSQSYAVQQASAPHVSEPEPMPEPVQEADPVPNIPVPNLVVPYVPVPAPAEAPYVASATTEAVAARVEAELPAAASAIAEAAEASGAEHHNIAQVVHRVMERMKGDLVDEIVRELRSKK